MLCQLSLSYDLKIVNNEIIPQAFTHSTPKKICPIIFVKKKIHLGNIFVPVHNSLYKACFHQWSHKGKNYIIIDLPETQ